MRRSPILSGLAASSLALLGACQTFSRPDSPEAARRQRDGAVYLAHPIEVGQLVVHADFMLPNNHPLLSELVAERALINERLGLQPTEKPIHVHLYAEEESYRQFVAREAPEFLNRPAIFIETMSKLAVYAPWNEKIAEDLRHEVAHSYLHAAVSDLPLWLDEGLAEYFEVGRSRHGVNRTHVEYLSGQLAVGGWRPNLVRLEQLHSAAEMTQLEYAEAWLWVHFLLESADGNPELLSGFLTDLRTLDYAASISERMSTVVSQPNAAVIKHLKSLAAAH